MKKQNAVNKMGFTLLELLIVILIIGLLSAISIPMYKKAVEKSKVSDALSTMQAVSKSEHGWYLVRNNYTKDFANLDIDLYDKDGEKVDGESFDSINYTFTLQDNAIKAERNNNEYTLYKLYEDGNIYCLPQDHYICEQYGWGVNKEMCTNMGALWSNMKNNCYNSPQEFCEANEMSYNTNTKVCGCQSTSNGGCSGENIVINEGGQCIGNHHGNSCKDVTINQGGECVGYMTDSCQNIYVTSGTCTGYYSACKASTFTAGSVCDTTGSISAGVCSGNYYEQSTCQGEQYQACTWGKFTNNSTCIASAGSDTCSNSRFSSSTCKGIDKYTCRNATFEDGSECIAGHDRACSDGTTFSSGSKCISNASYTCAGVFGAGTTCEGKAVDSCGWQHTKATFQAGSKCIAKAERACSGATYEPGSCCEGNYCQNWTPKCHCPKNADGSYPTSC